MKYRIHSYRHAGYLFSSLEEYAYEWSELLDCLDSISDEMIAHKFEGSSRKAKSISEAINRLIKVEMEERGWAAESYIFADPEYAAQAKGTWRLDFAKNNLSVEVAFNHRSDISWNLIKPTLASELNHVDKALQTSGGIIICATEDMKAAGGFDNAIGTFEDYVQYLRPMSTILSAPLAIIGLEAPETFHIKHRLVGGKKQGHVIWEQVNFPENAD
ncbi:MAG: hypothetical protein Q4F23_04575 [Coriobacteriia bacterium]|nr:hypothetical protein [Coriobacteriia bacterium]